MFHYSDVALISAFNLDSSQSSYYLRTAASIFLLKVYIITIITSFTNREIFISKFKRFDLS